MQAAPIEPIKTLYNELVAQGIPIVLISGREATLKEETLTCLAKDGYPAPSAMYLRNPDQKQPAAELKAEYRAQIEKQGNVIVANIGDQQMTSLVATSARRSWFPIRCIAWSNRPRSA